MLKAVWRLPLLLAGIATFALAQPSLVAAQECPRGTQRAGAECRPVQIPPNAELDYTGHAWECSRGYARAGSACVAVRIPDNAELDYTGHAWECSRGFARVGSRCVAVRIPENAELDYTGHAWECSTGYARAGNACVAVRIPANAELDYTGHAWECSTGYARVGSSCVAVRVPENAELDYTGHAWECSAGYRRLNDNCRAMTQAELAAAAKRESARGSGGRGGPTACYSSSILSPTPFMGNDGEVFRLADGSIWQVKYEYEYLYQYYPRVVICPSRGTMVVDGKNLDVEPMSGSAGAAQSPPVAPTLIESRIDGEFSGWEGDTIFVLQNGQIWQQSSYAYRYRYAYSPKVIIYPSGSGYKMKVDGVDGDIAVIRLK